MRSLNCLAVLTLCSLLAGVPAHAQSTMPKPLSVAETIQQWLKRGAPEEAMKVVDKQLKIYPNDPNLKFQRAVILEQLNQPEQAQELYVTLTQDHPELSEPQNNLGVLLAKKNLLSEARERFELALRGLGRRSPAVAILRRRRAQPKPPSSRSPRLAPNGSVASLP